MYDSAFPVWEYTQRKLNWNVKEMSVLLCLLKDYSQELRIKTETARQFSELAKTLATKPDNPNSIPGTCMVEEEENQLLPFVLWSPHKGHGMTLPANTRRGFQSMKTIQNQQMRHT